MTDLPSTGIGATDAHARMIIDSYRRWTGRELLVGVDGGIPGGGSPLARLFETPIVVLSHGIEADPVLNFGNRAAMALWEMDWEAFTRTPSRLTAEPMERGQRDRFLKQVSENGYVDDYTGVRISRTGRRFELMSATVWNLMDERGMRTGQAAAFREFRYL